MFADGTPDRVVDALTLVLSARANAELADLWSLEGLVYPAVESTIKRPVSKTAIPSERLPMLSVVRRSTRFSWQGKQQTRTARMLIEYYGPLTPKERLEEHWPMLHAVTESLVGALDGRLPGPAGVNVFELAGVFDIVEESIQVDANFADLTSDAIPFLALQVDVRHTRDAMVQWHEVRELPDLLELFARYVDARPANEQPAVATLTRTPAGAASAVAAGDDFDDDSREGFPE